MMLHLRGVTKLCYKVLLLVPATAAVGGGQMQRLADSACCITLLADARPHLLESVMAAFKVRVLAGV
jgi:hypothetical protein